MMVRFIIIFFFFFEIDIILLFYILIELVSIQYIQPDNILK